MKRFSILALLTSTIAVTALTGCPLAPVTDSGTGQDVPGQNDGADNGAGGDSGNNGGDNGDTGGDANNNGGTGTGGSGGTGGTGGGNQSTVKPLFGNWSGVLDCVSSITVAGQAPTNENFQQTLAISFDQNGRPVASPIISASAPKDSTTVSVSQVGETTTINFVSNGNTTTQEIRVTEATYSDNFVKLVFAFTSTSNLAGGLTTISGNGTQTYEATLLSDSKIEYKSASNSNLNINTLGVILNSTQSVTCNGILVRQ